MNDYQKSHDTLPLYLTISPEEGDALMNELKIKNTDGEEMISTSLHGVKIIKSYNIKPGEFYLTNDLPEMGG